MQVSLRIYRCSICTKSWNTFKECSQHCNQPHGKCNQGISRARVISTDIELRASDRNVGGRSHDDVLVEPAHPETRCLCNEPDELASQPDVSGNFKKVTTYVNICKHMFLYVYISLLCQGSHCSLNMNACTNLQDLFIK